MERQCGESGSEILFEMAEDLILRFEEAGLECVILTRAEDGESKFLGRATLTADRMMEVGREAIKKYYSASPSVEGNETVN